MTFTCDPEKNSIVLGENIILAGSIIGTGNYIEIEYTRRPTTLVLAIYGNDNYIKIGRQALFNNLRIDIGSKRWGASETRLTIGDQFSIGGKGRFLLPNSGNRIAIGHNCMFSNSIVVRGGEYPHLIFDLETGAYLDVSDGIFIGDHCWVGEGAYITKGVTIGRDCIVGARSVVTKRFDVNNAVIAGNPARIVKTGIQWVGNYKGLPDFPDLQKAFDASAVNRINQRQKMP